MKLLAREHGIFSRSPFVMKPYSPEGVQAHGDRVSGDFSKGLTVNI